MKADRLQPGSVVGGRYRIERVIGRGGMGVVAAATHVETGETHAVKVMHARMAESSLVVERFRREARILETVRHPGVVRIDDCGESAEGPFIVMELIEGETLLDRLQTKARLTPAELLPIVEGLCSALSAVHAAGVVHRDLKPGNVFLPADGVPPVKVIDFGVAKALDVERLTLTGHVVGTLNYMAPEQLRGQPVDQRTDLYAVGLIVHGALMGRPPFPKEPHQATAAILEGKVPPLTDVPPGVARVVQRALRLDPDGRYPSVRVLAEAFREAVLGGAPDSADATAPASPGVAHGITRPARSARAAAPTAETRAGAPAARKREGPAGERVEAAAARKHGRAAKTRIEAPPPRPRRRAAARMEAPAARERETAETRIAPSASRGQRSSRRWLIPVAAAVAGAVVAGVVALATLGPGDTDGRLATPAPDPSPERSLDPPRSVTIPRPSEEARVEISSDPAGAEVHAGDAILGTTPLPVPRPAPGDSRQLVLEKAGYEPAEVLLDAHANERVEVVLERTVVQKARPRARPRRSPAGTAPRMSSPLELLQPSL